MDLPVLEDLRPVEGKRVLVRCDFNVPISNGEITDDLRIRLPIETLTWLLDEGAAKLTVCTHLGRPKGKPDPKYSVEPVRKHLFSLLEEQGASTGRVELMENLRYNPGEEANDPNFVEELVKGQDLYVDDAFGAAHRAHASIVGPPKFLPSAAGRVLFREVDVLDGLLQAPKRPFVAVLGGAKVSDKLGVIEAWMAKSTRCSWGAGCASLSSLPRATPQAAHCSKRALWASAGNFWHRLSRPGSASCSRPTSSGFLPMACSAPAASPKERYASSEPTWRQGGSGWTWARALRPRSPTR